MFDWFLKKVGFRSDEKEETVEELKEKLDQYWNMKEIKSVTLIKGELKDSKRAIYIYLDYDIEIMKVLRENNPNWLLEEVASYPWIYTEGGIVSHKPIPRRLIYTPEKDEDEIEESLEVE